MHTNTPSKVARSSRLIMRAPCLKCNDALSRKADPALHWPAPSAKGCCLPPPSSPLPPASTPSIALHDGPRSNCSHAPDAQRLEAAACLLRTLSYRTRPFKALTPNGTTRPPVLAPEMRSLANQPDCQTFLRRMESRCPNNRGGRARNSRSSLQDAQSRAREI